MSAIKKIAVIGAESTGKSTLCEQLARHFQTAFTTEFARDYLPKLNREYTENDLLIMAKEQRRLETDTLIKAKDLLFCDTDIMNIRVWSEMKFGRCSHDLLKLASSQDYDMYLLLLPERQWTEDPLRENPDLQVRKQLTQYYLEYALSFEKPVFLLGEKDLLLHAIDRIHQTQGFNPS